MPEDPLPVPAAPPVSSETAAADLASAQPVEQRPTRELPTLHGVTLAMLLDELVAEYGWEELGRRITIRCFTHDPSISSSLKFLRRTPWARAKVEGFYCDWKQRLQRDRDIADRRRD